MKMKSFLRFLFKPLTLLNRLLPKNPKLVLFYSNLGFRDNVRALYDECIRLGLGKQVKLVCSLNDYKCYRPPEGQSVRFVGNKRGLFTFFRAGTVFYSFGKYPIKPARRQTVINLWHGMPLKAVGNMVAGCEKTDYNYFTYIIAAAPFFGGILQQCFSCRPEQILYCGQPRCDRMLREQSSQKRLILWLPTYRQSDILEDAGSGTDFAYGVPLLQSDEDCAVLGELLARYNFLLMIKPHPLQNAPPKILRHPHIRIVTEDDLPAAHICDLFPSTSALLTDYSSVFFDYLLLDKPIGFVLPDWEQYRQTRGFAVPDPLALMPGAKINSMPELLRFIEDVCQSRDTYGEQRRRVNELCNTCQTGDSTERLLQKAGLHAFLPTE